MQQLPLPDALLTHPSCPSSARSALWTPGRYTNCSLPQSSCLYVSMFLVSGRSQAQAPLTAAAVNETHANMNYCRDQMRPRKELDTRLKHMLVLIKVDARAEGGAGSKQQADGDEKI